MENEMDAENLERLRKVTQDLERSIRGLKIALARCKERLELEAVLAKRKVDTDRADRGRTRVKRKTS